MLGIRLEGYGSVKLGVSYAWKFASSFPKANRRFKRSEPRGIGDAGAALFP